MASEFSTDPAGVAIAWIRSHPETWGEVVPEVGRDEADRLVDDIVSGRRMERIVASSGRRTRRRWIAFGAAATVFAAGGAVAAYVASRGQPTAPEAGIACRAAADIDASAIVIGTGVDPIDACRELWEGGQFAEMVDVEGVPDLGACIDPRGPINVYPGGDGVCESLGLAEADAELSPENKAILALNDRIINEINATDCAPADVVRPIVEQIVVESETGEWDIVTHPEAETAECVKVAVDSAERTLYLAALPPQP